MTFVVALPYAVLFVPSALAFGNPQVAFLLMTGGLALAGSFAVEWTLDVLRGLRLRRDGADSDNPSAWTTRGEALARCARAVATISILTSLGAATLGLGSITQQVQRVGPSAIASLLGVFDAYGLAAIALLVCARRAGGLGASSMWRWIAALAVNQIVIGSMTAITAPTTAFLVFVVVTLLFFRQIRPRAAVAALVVACIVWPAVYSVRNSLREDDGVRTDASVSAFDRLRFDEQITRAEGLGSGIDLGQPGLVEIVRYGLVPRVLDPGRPGVSTGILINEFLGGSSTSAYTFLPVATTYFFSGAFGVVLVYAGWATGVALLRPTRNLADSPVRSVLFCLMIGGPLGWFATVPDSTIGMLQSLVSVLPIFIALQFVGRGRRGRATPRPFLPSTAGHPS